MALTQEYIDSVVEKDPVKRAQAEGKPKAVAPKPAAAPKGAQKKG
jgi:hypothetical protein